MGRIGLFDLPPEPAWVKLSKHSIEGRHADLLSQRMQVHENTARMLRSQLEA
jgi:hypothetical protein